MAKEENIILPVLAGLALLALFSSNDKKSPAPAPAPGENLTPSQFIVKYWPDAKISQALTGVPALVTITQAGLESGWGAHAPGYNYFGIKDSTAWNGSVQLLLTWECGPTGSAAHDGITDEIVFILPPGDPQGVCGPEDLRSLGNWDMYRNKYSTFISAPGKYSYRVRSRFRKYDSAASAFKDHGSFLRNNSRYSNAFNYTNDPEQFAQEIAAAGYATDPNYASKLISAMRIVETVLQAHHLS